MNDRNLTPDDPRLTAYALGELEGEERAAIEAALRRDPGLRIAVDEIRATTAQLSEALADEPVPSIFSTPPMALSAKAGAHETDEDEREPARARNVIRFPQLYFVTAGLAAACFALFLVTRPPSRESTPNPERARQPATVATAKISAPAVPVAEATPTPIETPVAPAKTDAVAAVASAVPPVPPPAPLPGPIEPTVTRGAVAANEPASTARAEVRAADDKNPGSGQPVPIPVESAKIVSTPPAPPRGLVPLAIVPSTMTTVLDNVITPLLPASSASLTVAGGPAVPADALGFAGDVPPPAKNEAAASKPVALAPVNSLAESARELLTKPAAPAPSVPIARDNNFVSVVASPISAFTIEPETSSYASVRRFLQLKRLPPRETVRIEELVNYFPYHYAPPRDDAPFAASMEVADAPWAPAHRLVRIGLKAREAQVAPRPPVNLMFVIDVAEVDRLPSRLPMIKDALQSVLGKLRPEDRVGFVTTRDQARLVLPPTLVAKGRTIFDALETVASGGATNRMRGIQLAYDALQAGAAVAGGTGRVILCTDGNAGITITAEGALARYLEGKARSGVALTAVGFGMGIYRDSLIDFLADNGTGNYGYIDSRRDAEKFLAEDVNGTAMTIAKDVKIEVEFNPARVASYRLIGYENRELGRDDFKAGTLAANEVSAGHAVTALFEVVPADGRAPAVPPATERLRYQPPRIATASLPAPNQNELLTVKVRYKKPGGAIDRKLDLPVADARTRFVDASADFKFAAAVAGFGMVLRDSPHKGEATLASVIKWAEAATAGDPVGYRDEFLELAREAQALIR